jgi:cbb3-type cytochrome oxidase maturation protein
MEGIFIALPIALIIAVAAVCGFVWAVRRDQFEDLDTPPKRMLTDDEPVPGPADRAMAAKAPAKTVRAEGTRGA